MGLWLMMIISLLAPLTWKLACALLRRRRAHSLLANLHDPLLDPFLQINTSTICVEFPFLSQRSLEMGTLRTFAIPSISRTLLKSGEYARNTSKRYDDMEILLREINLHHVDSLRGSFALRRLNFLHSHYAISNDDYLYVFCIFVLLPPEWASMYGYREWTELEKSSNLKGWQNIGTRMGIRNIPSTIAAATTFRDEYEAKQMIYADSNHEIAELNLKVLLNEIPGCLHTLVRRLIYAFLDDRLREALGYPKQPSWLCSLVQNLMKLHGLAVRWMPPRPLGWAQLRIVPDCPAIISVHGDGEEADKVHPLVFQRYKPATYEQGYKISELGGLKPGKLGDVFGGALLWPLEKCSNFLWPETLLKGKVHEE